MRSFVCLPLISTIVSLAFAMKTQKENTPASAAGNIPEVIVASPPVSGQNYPPDHSVDSFSTINAQQTFDINPSEIPLSPGSSGRNSKFGYVCQESVYRLQHLENTARHACKYIMHNKQMNGRVKYPTKFNDVNQPNTQYLFPVLPEKKIFTGGYLNFGLRLRHFLVIDSACEMAKVTHRFWEDPHKSSKYWCSWPKCFSKGNLRYLDCPALYTTSNPTAAEYFGIPSN